MSLDRCHVSKTERDRLVSGYRKGKTEVIVDVDIFSKGFASGTKCSAAKGADGV